MTIYYPVTVKNSLSDSVDDLTNAGAGSYGRLVFLSNLGDVIATQPMSVPAFGDSVQGTIVADALTAEVSASPGTITQFQIQNKDGEAVLQGSVGISGADINLTSVDIQAGDTISMSSLTYSTP